MAMTPEQRAANLEKARAARKAKYEARQKTIEPAQAESPHPLQVQSMAPPPVEAPISAPVVPDPNRPETIPPNLFSGRTRRLEDHNPRPGWVRWWCNDDNGGVTIGNAVKSGWTFVERTDAQLNDAVVPRNVDLGSKVAQYVGQDEAGQPMYAYLMEMPEWLYERHQTGPGSREEYHKQLEAQVRAGTLGIKQGDRRYTAANPYPGSPSGLPPITVDSKNYR